MMTVTLTPDTEMRLRAYAEKLALDPEQLSNALLTRDLEEAEAELQATMAGLDESVKDYDAGRWITAEEMSRQLKAHIAAARSKRNGFIPFVLRRSSRLNRKRLIIGWSGPITMRRRTGGRAFATAPRIASSRGRVSENSGNTNSALRGPIWHSTV